MTQSSVSQKESPNLELRSGNAGDFDDKPDTMIFANTDFFMPPSDTTITTGGTKIGGYYAWLWLMSADSWIEADFPPNLNSIGIQFTGDHNDGFALVKLDGREIWQGDTNNLSEYLEISNINSSSHRVRVENMGKGHGDPRNQHVALHFFGICHSENS